jgi:hypothetical protein
MLKQHDDGLGRGEGVDWFHLLQDRNKLLNVVNRAVTFGCIMCRKVDLIIISSSSGVCELWG